MYIPVDAAALYYCLSNRTFMSDTDSCLVMLDPCIFCSTSLQSIPYDDQTLV